MNISTIQDEFLKVFSNFSSLSPDDQARALFHAKKLKLIEADYPLRMKYYFANLLGIINGVKTANLEPNPLTLDFAKYIKSEINDFEINIFKVYLKHTNDNGNVHYTNFFFEEQASIISIIHPEISKLCFEQAIKNFYQGLNNYNSIHREISLNRIIPHYHRNGVELKYIINSIKTIPNVLKEFLTLCPEASRYANMI